MFKLKSGIVVALIVAMFFVMTGCDSGLVLYINAEEGDQYKTTVNANSVTEMTAQGQQLKTTQDLTTEFIITIDEVDSEGNITMNYKYDRVKIEASNANGIKQTFDSDANEPINPDDPMAGMFKNIIGNGFTVKMTKHGKIMEINRLDKFYESAIDSMDIGDSPNEKAIKEQLKQYLQKKYGKKAVKAMLQQSSNVYPKENIEVGDTWESNYDINTIVPMNIKAIYTLDKVEGEFAHLSVKTDFKTDSKKETNIMGMNVKADLKGKQTGTEKVNTNNGFLCNGEFVQEMEGKVTMSVPEQGSIEMPIKATNKFTYSTVKQ